MSSLARFLASHADASVHDLRVVSVGASTATLLHVTAPTKTISTSHERIAAGTPSIDAPLPDVWVATVLRVGGERVRGRELNGVVARLGGVRAIRTVSVDATHHAVDIEFTSSGAAAALGQWSADGVRVVVQSASPLRARPATIVLGAAALRLADAVLVCDALRRRVGSRVVVLRDAAPVSEADAALVDAVVADVEALRQLCGSLVGCVAINARVDGAALSFDVDSSLLFALPVLGLRVSDFVDRGASAAASEERGVALFDWAPGRELPLDGVVHFETLGSGEGVAIVASEPSVDGSASLFAITALAGKGALSVAFLGSLVREIEAAGGAVRSARMLSDSSADSWQCVELVAAYASAAAAEASRGALVALGQAVRIDVSLQADVFARRHKRMVVFDMDSTLIQDECIDEMGKFANVGAEIEAITRRAMNGELDFAQSLRSRVALLKGQPNRIFQHVLDTMTYTPCAPLVCAALKRLGFTLVLVSGGFTNIIDQVRADLALDFAHGNTLEVVDGQLTGAVLGEIVDAKKKAVLLLEIAQARGIAREQVIAIGDGANDLPMLGEAGLGVAFNAKPRVQEQARFRINQPTMLPLAYFMGLTSAQVRTLGRQ